MTDSLFDHCPGCGCNLDDCDCSIDGLRLHLFEAQGKNREYRDANEKLSANITSVSEAWFKARDDLTHANHDHEIALSAATASERKLLADLADARREITTLENNCRVGGMEEDRLKTEIATLRDHIARYENLITWQTSCDSCASAWDVNYDNYVREEEHAQMLADLSGELAEHESLLSHVHASDMRAIKLWQDAHPGNDNVWPDRTNLVVWLMEQVKP